MGGNLSILQIMLDSGLVVKGVLALLILASVWSWAIILKKRRLLREVESANREFLEMYQRSSFNLDELMEKGLRLSFSPYRSVFIHGVTEWEKIRGPIYDPKHQENARRHLEAFGPAALERAMKKGVNEANSVLEARLSTLASIGSVTPFVGLFGTVWGIINSFTGLASGGATLDVVAPGIAEALVATAIGLFSAIPAIWYYNDLSSQNAALDVGMESFAQDLLNQIERAAAKI